MIKTALAWLASGVAAAYGIVNSFNDRTLLSELSDIVQAPFGITADTESALIMILTMLALFVAVLAAIVWSWYVALQIGPRLGRTSRQRCYGAAYLITVVVMLVTEMPETPTGGVLWSFVLFALFGVGLGNLFGLTSFAIRSHGMSPVT